MSRRRSSRLPPEKLAPKPTHFSTPLRARGVSRRMIGFIGTSLSQCAHPLPEGSHPFFVRGIILCREGVTPRIDVILSRGDDVFPVDVIVIVLWLEHQVFDPCVHE